jgi:hypothetical protein
MLSVVYVKYRKDALYAECRSDECRYSECHYAECRCAVLIVSDEEEETFYKFCTSSEPRRALPF